MSTEPITTEATVASLVPVPATPAGSLVRPAAPIAEVAQAFNDYQALCDRLLDDSDVMRIGSREFRKKSAWRKLAVAFGVSCEITSREYERDDRGRIIRAEVTVRAVAPNGRFMEGLGACDLYEKCCPEGCRSSKRSHRHCPGVRGEPCSGALHFSNPSHDLPATAATRATNRACADLFGMGEVSAEEVSSREGEPARDGEPEPPSEQPSDAWYQENGWESKAQHDKWRDGIKETLRTLSDEQRRTYRQWREAEGIDLTKPVPGPTASKVTAKVSTLRSQAQKAEPSGGEQVKCEEPGCWLVATDIVGDRSLCDEHRPF